MDSETAGAVADVLKRADEPLAAYEVIKRLPSTVERPSTDELDDTLERMAGQGLLSRRLPQGRRSATRYAWPEPDNTPPIPLTEEKQEEPPPEKEQKRKWRRCGKCGVLSAQAVEVGGKYGVICKNPLPYARRRNPRVPKSVLRRWVSAGRI